MRESYNSYLVCVWDKEDRLYLQKRFEDLFNAIEYATGLISKYQNSDTINIYISKFESIWEQNGIKERI